MERVIGKPVDLHGPGLGTALQIHRDLHEARVEHQLGLGKSTGRPGVLGPGIAGIELNGLPGTHRHIRAEVRGHDGHGGHVDRHLLLTAFRRGHDGQTGDFGGVPRVAFGSIGPGRGRLRPSQGDLNGLARTDLIRNGVEVDLGRSLNGPDVGIGVARLASLVFRHTHCGTGIQGRTQWLTGTDHEGIRRTAVIPKGQQHGVHPDLVSDHGGIEFDVRIDHADDVVSHRGHDLIAEEMVEVFVAPGRAAGVAIQDGVVQGKLAIIASDGTAAALSGLPLLASRSSEATDGGVSVEGAVAHRCRARAHEQATAKGAAASTTAGEGGRAVPAVSAEAQSDRGVSARGGTAPKTSGVGSATTTAATEAGCGRVCIVLVGGDISAVTAATEGSDAIATIAAAAAAQGIAALTAFGHAPDEGAVFEHRARPRPGADGPSAGQAATTTTTTIGPIVSEGLAVDEQAGVDLDVFAIVDGASEGVFRDTVAEHRALQGQEVGIRLDGPAGVVGIQTIPEFHVPEGHEGRIAVEFEEAAVACRIHDGGPGTGSIDRDVPLIDEQLSEDPIVRALGKGDGRRRTGGLGLL